MCIMLCSFCCSIFCVSARCLCALLKFAESARNGQSSMCLHSRAAVTCVQRDRRLHLVYEPEAAAVSFISNNHNPVALKEGSTLMNVDCGGGSVDITNHKASSESCLNFAATSSTCIFRRIVVLFLCSLCKWYTMFLMSGATKQSNRTSSMSSYSQLDNLHTLQTHMLHGNR